MSYWKYHERAEIMGVDTSIFDKVLPPSGFTDEELLAREGLQNCKDAAQKDDTGSPAQVQVEVGKIVLKAVEKKRLFKALKFGEQKDHFDKIQNTVRRESLPDFLTNSEPLSIVYFSDHKTLGLGGKWSGAGINDNFSRLVVNISKCVKTGESGGSFGFGKTAFAKMSGLRLVLYYSHFKPEREGDFDEEVDARFMAVWLLKVKEDEPISGFTFFGGESKKRPGSVVPLVNEDAHRMAESCGLKRRAKNDYGATIAIVDCEIDMGKFKEAVERYWWPSIHDHKLTVMIRDEDETCLAEPDMNEMVKPYWEMYDYMLLGQGELPEGCTSHTLQRIEGIKRGQLCYRPIRDEEKTAILVKQKELLPQEEEQVLSAKVGGLARIREAGMVLSYDLLGMDPTRRPIAAVFIADKGIDHILRASEPQTHDRWDEHAKARILEAAEEKTMNGTLALRIVGSINSTLTRFITNATNEQPLPPPPDGYRLKNMEHLFAKFMNSGRGDIQSPDRPCSLKIRTQRDEVGGKRRETALIEIKMKDGSATEELGDKLKCRLVARCSLLGDTTGSAIGALPCHLVDVETGQQGKVSDGSSSLVLELKRGKRHRLQAVSYPGESDVVRFVVEVHPPKKKDDK